MRDAISYVEPISDLDLDVVPALIRSYASATADWDGAAGSRAHAGSASESYLRLSTVWNGRPAIEYLNDLVHSRN